MSKQLCDTELLELADDLIDDTDATSRLRKARECMVSVRDAYVDSMTVLATLTADHLGIKTTCDADWQDAEYPLVGFTPVTKGQKMPTELRKYDESGDWYFLEPSETCQPKKPKPKK